MFLLLSFQTNIMKTTVLRNRIDQVSQVETGKNLLPARAVAKGKNLLCFFVFFIGMTMLQYKGFSQCNTPNSTQWPTSTINAGTGALVTIATNSQAGDYTRVTGILSGAKYEFTISLSSNIITVRVGSRTGAVLGSGSGSVTVTATSASDLYVHWNTSSCGSSGTNRTTTVQGIPTITSLGSSSACVGGNITINGFNFTGVTAANVQIGGTAVSSITTLTATQIVAVVGSGTTGTVSVANSGGSGTSAATFTVNQLPVVTAPSPAGICVGATSNVTPASGGTWVSNSPTIASVSNAGLITGLLAGTSTFTFTNSTTGCSSTTTAVTVTANATLALTSAGATTSQTRCQNTAITNITYLVGGSGTGATVTGLPTGVIGSYNAGTKVFTITGSPSVFGTFNYTVTTTGPCVNPSLSGTITVTEASSLSLVTAGTNTQTICIGSSIVDINYTYGGTATGASITAGSLPAGVISGDDNGGNFAIVGTPTVTGTFNFTVTTAGPCPVSLTGTITVNANSTIRFTSAVGTDAQTKCINNAITNITYLVGGGGTGATITGLPTGVNGSYNSGTKVFTISGTPSVAGTFNYTVTTTGPCVNPSLGGSITVVGNSTITLSSGAGTNNQTRCINNSISDITFTVGGTGTGATVTGLPAGVTGSFNAGVFTISGTPTVSGSFPYTVTTTGPCVNSTATGTLTVNANSTISLLSAAGTDAQTKCINNAITNITYQLGGGATGATVTGLPTNVTSSYNGGTKVFTITGTPNVSGTFNYTVTASGPCINPSLNGTITVVANATISLTSGAGTNTQTVCQNSDITDITYAVGGTGTGATVTGLPAGVTGSYSAGVFTISGSPTTAVSGAFNYTVTTTGPCATPTATGTITVNVIPTTTGVTVCQGLSGSLTSSFVCADGSPVTSPTKLPTTGTTSGSGTAWTNPGNVTANDNANAFVSGTGTAFSRSLNATGFSFGLSDDATIKGIQVTIGRYRSGFGGSGEIQDNIVKLLKAGAAVGNNKGATSTNWPTTEGFANYGTATDLWGTTWSVSEINASDFGVTLTVDNTSGSNSRTANVDYIQVTITYTRPGSLNWYTASSGGILLGSGSPFNPVGVAGSPLANTNTPGTTTFYAECSTVAGCRTPTDFVINALPIVSITGSNPVCINGSTTLSPTSGGTWISNSANATVNNSGVVTPVFAGPATFTFTETATGCINTTGTLTINANSSIALSSVAGTDAQTVCINTPIINTTYAIGGSGTGASITSGGLPAGVTGSYSAGVFTISGTPTVNGTFNYTVTTDGPCVNNSLSGSITVTANATLSLTSASGTDAQAVCNNTTLSNITYLAGSGATGASITSGSLPSGVTGSFSAGVFTISGTPTAAGTYNYTITTTGGTCGQASASGSITVYSVASLGIAQTNVSQCVANNGTITITPTGGTAPYNYAWTGVIGSGNPATTPYPNPGNVSAVTNLTIGYYNVAVTDAHGCQSSLTNIHVQYAYTVLITNSGSTSSACGNTGSIILFGNAGVQPYTYSLDGTNYQSSNTFTNLAAGNYTAYVKDASGCASTKSITVAAAAPIVVSPNPISASSCSDDGIIQIFRSGGFPPYSYSLTSASGPWQTSNSFTGLAAGTYTCYVKDAAGCTGQQATTVTSGAALTVTASKVNTSSCVNDGSIQVNVAGGKAPYTYSKDNGVTFQSSNSFTGLGEANYAIVVKDSKGCVGSTNVTISTNAISVTSFATDASSCASGNGSIQLFRTGGTGPYSYSIDGNNYQSSNTFTGLTPGSYDCFVKDSKGCLGFQFGVLVGPSCPAPFAGSSTTRNLTTAVVKPSAIKVSDKSVLKISAYPNPSSETFTLVLEGGSNEKIAIVVTDLLGRKVYQAQADMMKQYKFGSEFKTGIYLLQVTQGNQKQTIKLVKE